MPLNISKRGSDMPSSPIRKLVPYADAAKARGIKVFHLNIGQPDIETPRILLDAVANNATHIKVLDYSHSAGNLSMRQAQVAYYKNLGITIDTNDIVTTTGGSEAILFAMMSLLDVGDEVIIPEPFYANYNGFCHTAGATILPVRSYIENNFALPPIAEIEKAITSKTKAIIICNPNNPTGYLYTKSELNQLKEIVKKHDLYLFADEAYKEFCYDGAEFISTLQLEGIEENVVMFDTISKRYSACGARIGSLVSKNKKIISTVMKFAQARLSPPSFGQVLAEAAIGLPTDYFEAIKGEYLSRRDLLVKELNEIEGVFCPNPGGAFYAIARLPIDDADAFCQWLLESFSYNQQTVMCAPATGFYATKGAGKQEVRLAYVINKTDLAAALICLKIALQQYPGKTN